MRITNQKDFVAGLMYAGFGGATALGSLRYTLGSASAMGPGYFPLVAGVVLLAIGVVVALGACSVGSSETHLERWDLRAIAVILVSVVLFATTIEPLGLIIALPLLVVISSLAHRAFTWRGALLIVAVMLPLVWLIFVAFLGLSFSLLPSILR